MKEGKGILRNFCVFENMCEMVVLVCVGEWKCVYIYDFRWYLNWFDKVVLDWFDFGKVFGFFFIILLLVGLGYDMEEWREDIVRKKFYFGWNVKRV